MRILVGMQDVWTQISGGCITENNVTWRRYSCGYNNSVVSGVDRNGLNVGLLLVICFFIALIGF